jgi:SAM-dependent methyltransferase
MLKLDIGCGAAKRSEFIGVDFTGNPDILCNVAIERLPFEDSSVDHIYSSHCLEHIEQNHLLHLFQEMTRVAADDALIELWHPSAFHSETFVFGHVSYLSEAIYDHLGCTYRSFWKDWLGAQWVLREIRYNVEPFVLEDLKVAGIEVDFAVCYMHDVFKEMGIFIQVHRNGSSKPNNYCRFVCNDRDRTIMQLSSGPRRQALCHAK